MVIITMGLPGSGKSYLAERLAAAIDAVYISSDKVRKEMYSTRSYSPEEKAAVYNEMLNRMKQAAQRGRHVVLDATFYKNALRQQFIHEARYAGGIAFIEVCAPEALIAERLQQERTDSEAGYQVYRHIKEQWEPWNEKHLVLHSAGKNIKDMLHAAVGYLNLKHDKATN